MAVWIKGRRRMRRKREREKGRGGPVVLQRKPNLPKGDVVFQERQRISELHLLHGLLVVL